MQSRLTANLPLCLGRFTPTEVSIIIKRERRTFETEEKTWRLATLQSKPCSVSDKDGRMGAILSGNYFGTPVELTDSEKKEIALKKGKTRKIFLFKGKVRKILVFHTHDEMTFLC